MILWGGCYLFPTNWERRQSSSSEGALSLLANDHEVNIHLRTVLTTKSAENSPSSHHHSFPLQRLYNGIVKMRSGGKQKLSPFFPPLSVVFFFFPGDFFEPGFYFQTCLFGSQSAAGHDEPVSLVHICHSNGSCPRSEPCSRHWKEQE